MRTRRRQREVSGQVPSEKVPINLTAQTIVDNSRTLDAANLMQSTQKWYYSLV
jgi:hypothetical protein